MKRPAILGAWIVLAWITVGTAALAAAAPPASALPATPRPSDERAVFAGGCFWCVEAAFEGRPGVKSVVSGYAGGPEASPTYKQVSSGTTGHAEVVQITFDPTKTSYTKLLEVFWHNIDPTQADGQFCDHGPQYRSAIFYASAAQKGAALESKRRIEAAKRLRAPIVTKIEALTRFWPAEEYHQDYYKKNPVHYQAYRLGCGRDARLKAIWGKDAGGH
jgi:peptide-methionine (S)-S-oxide reductase